MCINLSYFFIDKPATKFTITPDPALLGSPLDIECELHEPPSPNILNYTLSRKRESDLLPELLTVMASNETFDNTSVFIARFSTAHTTMLDYSEYTCRTDNLIASKTSRHYLDLDSGLWITFFKKKKNYWSQFGVLFKKPNFLK